MPRRSAARSHERHVAGHQHVGRRRRVRRFVIAVVFLVGLLAVIAVAGAAGVVVGATRGMPSLSTLQARSLPQTTLMYDDKGHLIAQVHGATDRLIVASRQIPAAMKAATVAI